MNIEKLLANANIYMVPLVNPSGYDYSRANQAQFWRKNRRSLTQVSDPWPAVGNRFPNIADPRPGTPLFGVDLNRNFPSANWGTVTRDPSDNSISTSNIPSQNTYFGRSVKEKETQAIVALTTRDRRFDLHIDVHSYSGTVGWVEQVDTTRANLRPDGGFNDDKVFPVIGEAASALIIDPTLRSRYFPQGTPYPTSGDILQWQYEACDKKCLGMLIEVGKENPRAANQLQNFHPLNATAHAEAVLPGELFMMFAAVDRNFSSKPKAEFRKP
jgi:hypothetical protein